MPFKSTRLGPTYLFPSLFRVSTSVFHPTHFPPTQQPSEIDHYHYYSCFYYLLPLLQIDRHSYGRGCVTSTTIIIDDGRWKFIRTYIAAGYTLEAFSPICVPPIYGPRRLPLSAPILIIINDCRASRGNAATGYFEAEVSSIRDREFERG